MAPNIPKQRDVVQLIEPVGIVDHDGIAPALAEIHEFCKDGPNTYQVASDFGVIKQSARLVLARWIADASGAAAHQDNRFVPALLKKTQQHDRHETADMQTVCGAVISNVGDKASRA